MNETYVECLVPGKKSMAIKAAGIFLVILTVLFALLIFLIPAALFLAVITGVGAYFVFENANVEYEYLYLDREISVDKIMGKSRRKRVAEYSLEQMEVFAPVNSWHLDNFRNRQVRTIDFSAADGEENTCFALYYEGGKKVLLTPTEEFVKALMNVAPRKVFKD